MTLSARCLILPGMTFLRTRFAPLALCVFLGIVLTLVYNRRPIVVPGNDQGAYMAMGVGVAGEGPAAKFPALAWRVALAAFGYLLVRSFRSEDRPRDFAVAVGVYLLLLIVAECRLSLDTIGRRLLVPVIPLAVVLAFHALRGRPRWRHAVVAGSVLVACAHAWKGRLY